MLRMIGDHKLNYSEVNDFYGNYNCHIYDARGYIAAMGNRLAGKGFESLENYKNCMLDFLDIPNIHKVR